MYQCIRCGIVTKEKLQDGDICKNCDNELEQEQQEIMSQMFDAEGNNL